MEKRDLILIFLAFFSFLAFVPALTYATFATDLADKESLINRNNKGVVLLDRHGQPFFQFYEVKNKKVVPLSEISLYLQNAVIAAEDKNFYRHQGYSWRALLAATVANIKNLSFKYGGSTITQQLAKTALLSADRNLIRKFQEIVLAQELERRYSKDEILEMYLNTVYFGEGAFGAEAAARVYFNKSAKELNLAESALLAGLLVSPSRLSPISGNREQAFQRQRFVLEKMVELKMISDEDRQQALATSLEFKYTPLPFTYHAPHFALMVRDELIKKYGEAELAQSGFVVRTTLDLQLQQAAEIALKKQLAKLKGNRATNGAVVVIDPKTGEVLALVGSKDWDDEKDGKVNMAITPRQSGSAFKPVIYLAALEKRLITPATILHDQPTVFRDYPSAPPYQPKNYDGRFRGNVTVRRALANSLNVPSVEVMQKLGLEEAVRFSRKMGFTTIQEPSNYGLSFVLGTAEVPLIELTNFYATLANQGFYNPPTIILEIKDKHQRSIYQYKVTPTQVADPKSVYLITSILSDRNTRSEIFGNLLDTPFPAAVKTGTTESFRGALTLGYNQKVAVGVWIGNNDSSSMDAVAGSLGAAPVWKEVMTHALANQQVEEFNPPEGLISLYICPFNGGVVKEATNSAYREFFLPGTEPKHECILPQPTPQPSPSPVTKRGISKQKLARSLNTHWLSIR